MMMTVQQLPFLGKTVAWHQQQLFHNKEKVVWWLRLMRWSCVAVTTMHNSQKQLKKSASGSRLSPQHEMQNFIKNLGIFAGLLLLAARRPAAGAR